MNKNKVFGRRSFLKTAAVSGAALSIAPGLVFGQDKKVSPKEVRIGFIGIGGRGKWHLRNILKNEKVIVPAICDIDPEAITRALNICKEEGHKKPDIYDKGEYAFMNLLAREDIDGVVIATPWTWHTPMSVAAMKAGKYVGVEVSASTTMQECWDLVNTYEETKSPLMILENVCYRRDVLAVLNMVREGVFGELLHANCGYRHDLRPVKFRPGAEFGKGAQEEARWRTQHSLLHNGDLYPTHGVGPVAEMMNINRGNQFLTLTSHATKSRGLHKYIVDHGGENHPNAKLKWALGDIVTTTIDTANGETIIVTHDTNSPRPYSLDFKIQGTQGLTEFDGLADDIQNHKIYIEGKSKRVDKWDNLNLWLEKYDHPLWKKYGKFAVGAGHGGMDFFVDRSFVETVRRKVQPQLDVYDAAAWSAITPLSERSIAEGGMPQAFPDFTRGQWIKRKPVFAFNDDY